MCDVTTVTAKDPRLEGGQRENTPEEERLAVLFEIAFAACSAALEAHEQEEGADCECSLHYDLRGLEFNLETANAAFSSDLLFIEDDRREEITRDINQRIHVKTTAKRPELARLLWLLKMVGPYSDAVLDFHDDDKDHYCVCTTCRSVWSGAYNVNLAGDLIEGQIPVREWPEPPELTTAPSDSADDVPALVVASADLSVAKRAPAPTTGSSTVKRPRNYWEPSND